MKVYHSFNKRIERFLIEQPDSRSSVIINKLKSYYPNMDTYFDIYDTFFFELNVSFENLPIYIDESEKVYSYIPVINYSEGNLLNEKPRKEKLYDDNCKISFDKCYEYLAKALTYRLVRIENFPKLINTIITQPPIWE